MTHIKPLKEAMDARAVDQLGDHLSDKMVLNSPFLPDPFTGKEAALRVLKLLLSTVDEFQSTGVIADEGQAAVSLRIRSGDAEVTGVNLITVDAAGLVDSMTIQWRPLAGIVAIQQKIAPLVGMPALELVPKATP